MAAPVWTSDSSLGITKHLASCTKTLTALNAISFSVISGQLPNGLTLSSNGIISGIPKLSNIPANVPSVKFTFTVRASNNSSFSDKIFTLDVLTNNLYVPEKLTMSKVRVVSSSMSYLISKGTVDFLTNTFWKLENGSLPPGMTLSPLGEINISPGHSILPFQRETFIKPSIDTNSMSTLSQESWGNWFKEYLSEPRDKDYQFVLSLSDSNGISQLSVTVRVLILKAPQASTWFATNINYLQINSNQDYIFFAISESDYIYWDTDSNLGNVINGSVSELGVKATSISDKLLTYSIKPLLSSRLPQQLTLLNDGLISGRISFRCYQDDPINVPVNDEYQFTIRAITTDNFTYSEKTFNLKVVRFHEQPYNNLWIRSFPDNYQRQKFNQLISNRTFFPEHLLYRSSDRYFGKIRHLRFLFAAGLAPASSDDYYSSLISNHYNKVLLLGEVKTAVALDSNFQVKYEVVYVPVVDYAQISNLESNAVIFQPNIIDLRDKIKNFFRKDGQLYYNFEPNGLENMRLSITSIGYTDNGVLPTWMTSLQPVPNQPGLFYSPTGYIPCIVLAYTIPGASNAIAHRLKQAGINFNIFKFEFDRYELDDNLSRSYEPNNGSFLSSGSETTFDSDSTIFEDKSTRFNVNLDYSTILSDRDPYYGTKYLKFPKFGVFV